jgi:hypothetical protein
VHRGWRIIRNHTGKNLLAKRHSFHRKQPKRQCQLGSKSKKNLELTTLAA